MMSCQDTCIDIRIYVSIHGGVESLHLD